MRRSASETEEDCIARLHGDEGSKGVVDGTIDQSGDEATPEEKNVGVCGADFGGQVPLAAVKERLRWLGNGRLLQGNIACRDVLRRHFGGLAQGGNCNKTVGEGVAQWLCLSGSWWFHDRV